MMMMVMIMMTMMKMKMRVVCPPIEGLPCVGREKANITFGMPCLLYLKYGTWVLSIWYW